MTDSFHSLSLEYPTPSIMFDRAFLDTIWPYWLIMAAMCAMMSLNKFETGTKTLHYICQVLFGYDLVRIPKSGIAGGNCDLRACFSKNIRNCPLSVSEKIIQLLMSTAIK